MVPRGTDGAKRIVQFTGQHGIGRSHGRSHATHGCVPAVLIHGRVRVDGADPVFMLLTPEEMFFRSMRHEAFDVCELSFSSYSVRTARGDCPYVAIPVFLSRMFRHTSIYVRKDRIRRPEDLKGRRVGVDRKSTRLNSSH